MVEDFDPRFRADDFAGHYGADGAGGNALRQPGRGYYQSAPWLAYAPRCLAHHAVVSGSNTAPLLVRFALSLRAKLKRSKMAVEHTRRGSSSFVVGWFNAAPSDVSGARQFFTTNL